MNSLAMKFDEVLEGPWFNYERNLIFSSNRARVNVILSKQQFANRGVVFFFWLNIIN